MHFSLCYVSIPFLFIELFTWWDWTDLPTRHGRKPSSYHVWGPDLRDPTEDIYSSKTWSFIALSLGLSVATNSHSNTKGSCDSTVVLESRDKYRLPADWGSRTENAHMGCFTKPCQMMYFLILFAGQIEEHRLEPECPNSKCLKLIKGHFVNYHLYSQWAGTTLPQAAKSGTCAPSNNAFRNTVAHKPLSQNGIAICCNISFEQKSTLMMHKKKSLWRKEGVAEA